MTLTQDLHRKCEDLAVRLAPSGANLTVFAESDAPLDNILWSIDLFDDEHRVGSVEMVSSAMALRQSQRYGAIFFDGRGAVTISAVSRGEDPVTRMYEVHQQADKKVLVPFQPEVTNRIFERLFDMSSRNDPDQLQLAELGLAPAVVYGHPKLDHGGFSEQRQVRRTLFH